jgi:hypothetical protein
MNHWSQPSLRLSDRDRRAALRRLSRERARDRIDASELGERVDAVRSARTHGDLAPVFSDLAPVFGGGPGFRRGFPFPLLPLLVLGIVVAATGHVGWIAIAVAAVLILVFAPWRRRRGFAHRSWAC